MNGKRNIGWVMGVGLVIALAITACAPAALTPTEALVETEGGEANVQPVRPQGGAAPTEEAAGRAVGAPGYAGPAPTAVAGVVGGESVEQPPAADRAAAESGVGGGPAVGAPGNVAPPPLPTVPGRYNPPAVPPDSQFEALQAGEVDDNRDFARYLQYRIDFHSFVNYPVLDLDVSERHIIRVTNRQGRPVLGADVAIYDGQSLVTTLHTPATGVVYFFPLAYPGFAGAQGYEVVISRGQTSTQFSLTRQLRDALWEVELNVPATRPPVALDVLFLIDSTGSMGDEIEQLKENILSISAQIAALPSRPDVRFGMVTYRDLDDQYVTQVTDFTRNVQGFQQALMNVYAAGGGDDPESLNQALYEAVNSVSWRGGETVQLVFLVADAPPHLDYVQDYGYDLSLLQAAQRGIKINPIASRLCEHRDTCASDRRAYQEQAEYIFRQLAQFTGGRYIFLAYEDTPTSSGTPGTESHVGEDQYTVGDLDALVVRLIQEELAALEGGQQ